MTTVLRWTGMGKLVSFYRYFAFNGPRLTTALGIVLLLGIAAIRLYWLAGGFPLPAYLVASVGLLLSAALLAAVCMVLGRRPGLVRFGWALGAVVSAVSSATYLASRTVGLPGLPQLVDRWDYALGTFAIALAALFVALHFSVVTGMNVAYPHQRHWHD
ncbi:MAG: hypothetical protein JO063_02485 [Pseudonocardiales bacterium]|nr:hypothetical protein [Pseudonocardiales bacterium]MBV9028845.1 hypothetical protein [Pseudonocardiales bacterium]MBW0008980.1 hypothetical protein [Pseudonocardiales bacterium]